MKLLPQTKKHRDIPRADWRAIFRTGRREYPTMMLNLMEKHRDLARFASFFPLMGVFRPEYAQRILLDNASNYLKTDVIYHAMRAGVGRNMLTEYEEKVWAPVRKNMQPDFHLQALPKARPKLFAACERSAERIRAHARTETAFDFYEEMLRLSLDITQNILFSGAFDAYETEILEFGQRAMPFINGISGLLPWLPIPTVFHFKNARKTFETIIQTAVEERRHSGSGHNDLFDRLLQHSMEPLRLIDEIKILIMASYETGASGLTWLLYLLLEHHDAYVRVCEEIERDLGGNLPEFSSLRELSFTRQVYQETLRLYPPIWLTGRQSLEEDDMYGYKIPKGMNILLCPYAIQRHPEYWEHPHAFIPERFDESNASKRIRGAYFPFGLGPRICIGSHFHLFEVMHVFAFLLQRFHFTRANQKPVELEPFVTLQMKGGFWVYAHDRKKIKKSRLYSTRGGTSSAAVRALRIRSIRDCALPRSSATGMVSMIGGG